MQEAREEKYRTLAEKVIRHQAPFDEGFFNMIIENGHVFIDWKSRLEIMMKDQYQKTKMCDFALAKEEFFSERVALAFPRGSPWIEKFNVQ